MITQKQAEEIVKRYSPTTKVIVTDSDSMDGIYLQKTNTISIAHNWSVAGLLHEITHAVLILEDGRVGHDGVFSDRFTKIVGDYYGEQIARLQEQLADISKPIERLQEQLNEANELLLDFCSEYECLFDHNGYCQAHNSCEGGYKCIQKDLKKYLEKWGVR